MFNYFVVLLILSSSRVFGVSVIDSGRRNNFSEINNETDNNEIDGNQDDDCSNLTPELIKEIKSHQSVVDDIVNAIVNGKYSGDTWNA